MRPLITAGPMARACRAPNTAVSMAMPGSLSFAAATTPVASAIAEHEQE